MRILPLAARWEFSLFPTDSQDVICEVSHLAKHFDTDVRIRVLSAKAVWLLIIYICSKYNNFKKKLSFESTLQVDKTHTVWSCLIEAVDQASTNADTCYFSSAAYNFSRKRKTLTFVKINCFMIDWKFSVFLRIVTSRSEGLKKIPQSEIWIWIVGTEAQKILNHWRLLV